MARAAGLARKGDTMRELTESVIVVRYTLTEAAYRKLVENASNAVKREYEIRIPIESLTPYARLAVIDLPTNMPGGLNSSFSLRWPDEVQEKPTADDLSDLLLSLLKQHQDQQEAITNWITLNKTKLTDGRWHGGNHTYPQDFERMGCEGCSLKINSDQLPRDLKDRAKKAYQEKLAAKKARAGAKADRRFEAYLACLVDHPLQATRDGKWITGPLPDAPATSMGTPHGDGFNVPDIFQDLLKQIQAKAEALLSKQTKEKEKTIEAWVAMHGTDSQQARFKEGFLPNDELWSAIRAWVFGPLDLEPFERYAWIEDGDVDHTDDCHGYGECEILYDVEDIKGLDEEQYEVLVSMRQRAKECPIKVDLEPRIHTAMPYCASDDNPCVMKRCSVLVNTEFCGRPLSREYAL
jgi:hypothetical protein